jgi:hypothetical protein
LKVAGTTTCRGQPEWDVECRLLSVLPTEEGTRLGGEGALCRLRLPQR